VRIATRGLALLACLALASCGGEGGNGEDGQSEGGGTPSVDTAAANDQPKRFLGNGYSFSYPADWALQDPQIGSATGPPISSVYLGLDTSNLLGVLVGEGAVSITEANVHKFAGDVAEAVEALPEAQITQEPTPITVDGLPGYLTEASLVAVDGLQVQSQVVILFDGLTQYFLNCQFSAEHVDEMTQGCGLVRDTFRLE